MSPAGKLSMRIVAIDKELLDLRLKLIDRVAVLQKERAILMAQLKKVGNK
jgi:hypothetical protein